MVVHFDNPFHHICNLFDVTGYSLGDKSAEKRQIPEIMLTLVNKPINVPAVLLCSVANRLDLVTGTF